MEMKNILIIGGVIVLVGVGVYALSSQKNETDSLETTQTETTESEDNIEDIIVEEEVNFDSENYDSSIEDPENGINLDMEQDIMEETSAGTFEDYDESKLSNAETGEVVIFFNASWCPSCRALKSDIEANLSSIPAGTTILSADYDTYTDLKKKYGVTTQHTLVQVDKDGNQITKWSGGSTLDTILDKIQ